MMGLENDAVDQLMDALMKNGMKQEVAQRKARSFVCRVKSQSQEKALLFVCSCVDNLEKVSFIIIGSFSLMECF